MRLIDADKLIEHITNTADLGGWIGEALQQIKQVAIKYINLAPSIDIVRCRECKHRKPSGYVGSVKTYECDITGFRMHDLTNHFCSYGEREGE